MKKILLTLLLVFSAAQADKMDELLLSVKQSGEAESRLEKERLDRFASERNERKKMLEAAKAELAKQEARSRNLTAKVDANEKVLKTLEEELHRRSGTLGELFGVVRQNAGEFKAVVSDSVISAQFGGREADLSKLAASRELPERADLERFWYLLTQEMTESGRIARFKAVTVNPAGEKSEREVVRIGAFGAVSEGRYLNWQSAANALVEPAAQPAGSIRSQAEDFEEAREPETLSVDPTRGSVLSLLALKPSFATRMTQGGLIGYLILLLGLGGVIFGLWRAWYLHKTDQGVKRQLSNLQHPQIDNPLGRVQKVWLENRSAQPEALSAAMDEAILKELPDLEKGQGALKLLAAVAPLLGLLGTVVGMIATFQSITLFGTGDPKLMAGGISLALVTTMQGLIVAVPLLFMHGWLRFRSGQLIDLIESQSAGLMAETLEARRG